MQGSTELLVLQQEAIYRLSVIFLFIDNSSSYHKISFLYFQQVILKYLISDLKFLKSKKACYYTNLPENDKKEEKRVNGKIIKWATYQKVGVKIILEIRIEFYESLV